jgi:dinuclear metal center YbgI/SA1388 family protein
VSAGRGGYNRGMNLHHLVADLDALLESPGTPDYCPNGLQVEGHAAVHSVVTGVSASRALFSRAAAMDADAVLVHHGILWNGAEPPRLVGSFRERVRILLENDLSLIAYHLPLDRHLRVGNAAGLARRIGLDDLEPFGRHQGLSVGVCGQLAHPLTAEELAHAVHAACEQTPQLFPGDGRPIQSVGIATGAAEREYHRAVAQGLDAFITGEATEWVMHQAAEDGVAYLAAGHYATERFGVQALGTWIERELGLDVTYVDVPNPV